MTSTLRIFVAGPLLAGASSTLRHLGRWSHPEFDPRSGPAEGPWTLSHSPDLSLIVRQHTRTTDVHDLVSDVAKDARYQLELDYLSKADGFIYVVDSQTARLEANCDVLNGYKRAFKHLGRDLREIAMVFQLNKQDLPNLTLEAELRTALQWPHSEYVRTIAHQGIGIGKMLTVTVQLCKRVRSSHLL